MKAKDSKDGQWYFFVDNGLLFGASISCAVFQAFLDAVAHIIKYKTAKEVVNYLDDFLFIALLAYLCSKQLETFMEICQDIGFPVSLEKTCWPTTQLIFLGLLIDTVNQLILLPVEKIEAGKIMIEAILNKKNRKITVKQLQQLCGFLNFLGQTIVPHRAFTRKMYNANSKGLKAHHHIKVNQEMRLDLEVWRTFLYSPSVYLRPFLDCSKTLLATDIGMYSDATKNTELGFGAICRRHWMMHQWNTEFVKQVDPSIEYLELYAVLAAVLAWIHKFRNQRIVLHCDNMSVVEMINSNSSRCKICMVLI